MSDLRGARPNDKKPRPGTAVTREIEPILQEMEDIADTEAVNVTSVKSVSFFDKPEKTNKRPSSAYVRIP